MTLIERKIQEFEARPAAFHDAGRSHRAAMLSHFSAINRFEGIVPSDTDTRLFQLLATGKISKREYLDLCITDARGAISCGVA